MSENFFSRWSRRKQGLETSEAPQTEAAAPPPMARTGSHAPVPAAAPPAAGAAPTSAPGASPADAPTPVPTMADVQHLTPSSDFQNFVRKGVPGEVRNAAMKKLFTDPHFNVMDGLDIYIGDYNTPDPLPAGMLEKMVGAELLNLFPPKAQADAPQTTAVGAQENPAQSPDAPNGPPLVAQSPQSPTPPALQTPPVLQASDPLFASPEHDHPDLQLQPNHAPASPDPGQSTG